MTTTTRYAWPPHFLQKWGMRAAGVGATIAKPAGIQTREERPFVNKTRVGLARTVAMIGLLMTVARKRVEHARQISGV